MPGRIVNPPELAPAVGFSYAVVSPPGGMLVHLGGQTAQGPDGGIVGDGIVEQFDVAAGNVMVALTAAGGRAEDIVSMQIFVTEIDAYKAKLRELGAVWRRHFGREYPAAGLFGVTRLFDEAALVELMAVAVIEAPR
jgi:enamine deaminase RidA (YjgF/YER057c/UK114 family)